MEPKTNQEQGREQLLSEQKLSKKERKLLKRAEREKARNEKKRKNTIRKAGVVFLVVFALLVAGLGIFVLIANSGPKGEDFSISHPSQGRQHIAEGALHPEYNSNPPTSGWHYAAPAKEKFYDEELEDEQIVHNLEHGDIWIAYRPTVSDEVKKQLKKLSSSKVIVTPRSANNSDIAVVAWGRLDTFDIGDAGLLDVQRIKDFISRYRNQGPERIAPAGGHGGIGTN